MIAWFWAGSCPSADGAQLPVECPGAIHHVMNRGDRQEPIFKDDEDRQRFLAALGKVCI
jgi:hypothetical protein